MNSLSTYLHVLVDNVLKKSLTAVHYILPGSLEIAGEPRGFDIAGTVGEVHQQMHLVGKIAPADVVHVS